MRAYHDEGKISCTIVRPANVTGPGSVWVRDIVERMMTATGVPLFDHGQYNTSFVYVDSLVDGIIRAGTMDIARGKSYHFRDDWNVTWKEYITDLGSFIGKRPAGKYPFPTCVGDGPYLGENAESPPYPFSADEAECRGAGQGQ